MAGGRPQREQGSTPYSTGGGGTVLEHVYGATLLGDLLTGDPVPMLGDDAVPVSVRFQASAESPVDDLLVSGRTPDGGERRVAIGVRRSPAFVTSDQATQHLLASYLRVLTERWPEIQAGTWRLGLAVASPNPAVRELRELCGIARASQSGAGFREEVARPGRTNGAVRARLVHVDALVSAAVQDLGLESDVGAEELTWRLLSVLRLAELRLEGVDQSDRTASVSRLRGVTREQTPGSADQLFARLTELAGTYAPAGADVTEQGLRRDLSGVALARSASRVQAWSILDGLATRLRDTTGFRLRDSQSELELERLEARESISAEMTAAGTSTGTLVVHGEPDVGKSALTLRAAEGMGMTGVAATVFSLRDLPPTTLELEGTLGSSLGDVLGATAVEPARLLVIDGAESVLEGRAQLLQEVATAALRAGLGVVVVSRTDGKTAVAEALAHAMAAAGVNGEPRQFEVARLAPAEVSQVAAAFNSLNRLSEEPRDAWLLGRLGLVDLLLRAGAALDLPVGPLSEAHVFAAIWERLVRHGEATGLGEPSPDSRERALTSLARRLLVPGTGMENAEALPSLRSDGLLLPAGPTAAWAAGDQFASDLIRDLSVAKLLISEGWSALEEAGAPRWALRAVRLACQARLIESGDAIGDARRELESVFADLASRHGERWAEVPLEAMLTLGTAREVLREAWPELMANDQAGLRTLLRLALQRYTKLGVGDPGILAPLVELSFCGDDDLGQLDRYGRGGRIGETIRELVLAWLLGLATSNAGPGALRQQVRDKLIAAEPERHDEFAVEALAMLGPDLDEPTEAFLRGLAADAGTFLAPAVEQLGPIVAMSAHQPELLLALAEAYYIEEREVGPFGRSSLDDGIRDHYKKAGFGMPMAAFYFGPFFRLLNTRPVDTIAFINRMLDHAAATRVGQLGDLHESAPDPESPLPGLDLDLPGVGMRRCVGDAHVWSWYRGSSVGPYTCMSALLALERFADHLVDTLDIPIANMVELLLRECHNLAMVGFVVGLLERHPEKAGDQADRWLVLPEIWHLEFGRAVAEGTLHVQGPDGPEVVGRERRRATFRDVGSEMTIRAMLRGDQARLEALRQIGEDLIANAEARQSSPDEMAAVRGWASVFHIENYRAEETEDGRMAIVFEAPGDVAAGLVPSLAALARGNEALRVQMKYGRAEDRVAPTDTLIDDLALARELQADPPVHGPLDPRDAVAAVAAAAIIAVADGRIELPAEDLRWAADVLIDSAMHPQLDQMSYEGSIYGLGADRSAAVAWPALLLPVFDDAGLDRETLGDALGQVAMSLFDEVRAVFAMGAARVWGAACGVARTDGACRHELLWAATRQGLRDCRLGPWNQTAQQRLVEPLEEPYETTLPLVPTDDLRLNRLVAPLVLTADAVLSNSCVAARARPLLDALMDAHRRSSDHWATEGYGGYGVAQDGQRASTVRVLVEFAVAGDVRPLTQYARAFASNARALERLLHDLCVLFTYDADLRPYLGAIWRDVMVAVLDAVDAGADFMSARHWSEEAVGGLLPVPQITMMDTDVDATLERAQREWVAPDAIADLVERWFPLGRREPKAADAVTRLGRCASDEWQATTGLEWTERVIDGRYDLVAGICWYLLEWLERVRASGRLAGDGTARWRRIVDGLAAEGDDRAVRLQQAEE
jgi:hypothetical protein